MERSLEKSLRVCNRLSGDNLMRIINLSFKDIRFHNKGGNLYAFCLGIPTEDIIINHWEKIPHL